MQFQPTSVRRKTCHHCVYGGSGVCAVFEMNVHSRRDFYQLGATRISKPTTFLLVHDTFVGNTISVRTYINLNSLMLAHFSVLEVV